jgi:plastocyanin
MHRSVTSLFAALFALPLAAPLLAATIEVQVASPGGGAVSDAVVYAVPARPIPAGHKVATMDQKDRVFVPHILPIQTGTWVEFPNSDNIRHQVYSLSPAKRFQLPLYTGKPAYPLQFGNPGVVAIGCNIHEQMNAYIVVVDTPYFAKSEGGRVSLQNVEPGQYTLHVWYPEMRAEPKPQVMTVAANDHPTVSFVAKN